MNEVDQKHLTEDRVQHMMLLVNMGLRLLSMQAVLFFALVLDTIIFSWAMYSDSWIRLAGAALFAVTTWCLIHLRPKGEKS